MVWKKTLGYRHVALAANNYNVHTGCSVTASIADIYKYYNNCVCEMIREVCRDGCTMRFSFSPNHKEQRHPTSNCGRRLTEAHGNLWYTTSVSLCVFYNSMSRIRGFFLCIISFFLSCDANAHDSSCCCKYDCCKRWLKKVSTNDALSTMWPTACVQVTHVAAMHCNALHWYVCDKQEIWKPGCSQRENHLA